MLDYPQLLLLGAFAGLTIFLGLPLAVVQSIGSKMKGFLNAIAIGILIFLTIDVFGHAWEPVIAAATLAFAGRGSMGDAALYLLTMFGGMAVGLLGLTWYETRYVKGPPLPRIAPDAYDCPIARPSLKLCAPIPIVIIIASR